MDGWNPQAAIDSMHQTEYRNQLETARGLLLAAADQLERTGIEVVYQGKDTGPELSAIMKVLTLPAKLRKLMREVPQHEKTVQNAFEDLLIGADLPYSREAEHIEYSSKTYVPDFTMSKLDMAIEIKLCNRETREKEIIAEINDDVLAYRTKYSNLVFVIYDVGLIRDTDRFAADLEEHENVVVRVVKH